MGGAPRKKFRDPEKKHCADTKTSISQDRSTTICDRLGASSLIKNHGRSVSWGSWADNAEQGHHYSLVVPLLLRNWQDWSIGRFAGDCLLSQSFGSRLRYERERRQIALRSIAESTKIGFTLLDGLERDDVSRWPSGIFRKSFVKSYAEAIGLDADSIVREFVEHYPDPLEVQTTAPLEVRLKPDTTVSIIRKSLAIKLTITL